ncbi:Synaptojanin-1 [Echinococcus granulosus]|uniref:phosphoinositide 5-phosphatase n=1 Tax=Echinococcus granulosus TaxID=6210 RepID=W6UKN5_ECHGR|nr:Synaptojanin-1 [Echinococcus granulosus]EUB62095.1 Synaptojanin-1 [Echinococcus granulosus]
MAYPRGWRLSYHKQLGNSSQQSICVILERRDKQEFLRFDAGAITELNLYDFSLIKDQIVKIADFKKLLSSGAFYFAKDLSTGLSYDITRSAQSHFRLSNVGYKISDSYDQRFLWNRGLMSLFFQQRVSPSKWVYPVICGSFGVSTLYAGLQRAQIGVVSRLSTMRPGTRFNVRGVDDNGYVANFVETEVFISVDKQVLSHVQIRGTVPLFWEQPGLQVGSHKIKIFRFVETSLQAFNRHFAEILSRYSNTVILNLMGSKDGEGNLSRQYKEHWNVCDYRTKIKYIHFDYHACVNSKSLEGVQSLLSSLKNCLDDYGYYHVDGTEVRRLQIGVVRTNCVDCSDRTNIVQTMISTMLLTSHFLKAMNLLSSTGNHTERHAQEIFRSLWLENGDNVSRIYTGTGALRSDRSKLRNAQRSAARTIKNNFFDSAKQEAMVSVLNCSSLVGWQRLVACQFLPPRLHFLPQSVLQNILDRNAEFTRRERLKVFIGTWNVNGGRNVRSLAHWDNNLSDWLLESRHNYTGFRNPYVESEAFTRPTDIFVVGFEEIIDLNASNVVANKQSSENQQYWGTTLQTLFDQASETGEPYVLLCTTQLVGVCIFVFLRLGLCEYVRGLASASVKTGLHAKAGNKGAVAVRFQIGATSLCFCCSHLTAGQSAYRERNAEVLDISQRLTLAPDKRSVLSHDYVFWFGDLNYRINRPNEEVKSLVTRAAWSELQYSDQLLVQRKADAVFKGFNEGPLCFAPTYKYDLFCDDYDTSEKARSPSWTDRVLWRRANIAFKKSSCNNESDEQMLLKNLLVYYRAEIKTSDHRPVAAVFDIDIQVVEPTKRRQVIEEELLAAGPGDATVRINWICGDTTVTADAIHQAIVELAGSAGTIILTRPQCNNQLLLTFSSPPEAVEAVRCLNGNKVSVETSRQKIVLSVCLNSTPRLLMKDSNGISHSLEGVLSGSRVLDDPTREWLEEMRQLVDEADEEYLRTHGPSPEHAVFQPTVSLAHLRRKENVAADEVRRQRIVSILSNEDQALINLWDDEDEEASAAMSSIMVRLTEQKEKCDVFHSAVSPPVPPRPPPPAPAVHLPDLSMLKELLPPKPLLHPVHSCIDLLSELDDSEYATTSGQFPTSTLQPLPPTMGFVSPMSASVSPQHTSQLPPPPPPKRLPPRPPPQLHPSSLNALPQHLVDLSERGNFCDVELDAKAPRSLTLTRFGCSRVTLKFDIFCRATRQDLCAEALGARKAPREHVPLFARRIQITNLTELEHASPVTAAESVGPKTWSTMEPTTSDRDEVKEKACFLALSPPLMPERLPPPLPERPRLPTLQPKFIHTIGHTQAHDDVATALQRRDRDEYELRDEPEYEEYERRRRREYEELCRRRRDRSE